MLGILGPGCLDNLLVDFNGTLGHGHLVDHTELDVARLGFVDAEGPEVSGICLLRWMRAVVGGMIRRD